MAKKKKSKELPKKKTKKQLVKKRKVPVKKPSKAVIKKAMEKFNKRFCLIEKCYHEKCHYLKFIEHLWIKRRIKKFFFSATLIPYQRVWAHKQYGIIVGTPDFFISYPKKNQDGEIVKIGLYIELKTEVGKLSASEIAEIKRILKNPNYMVGVCHGVRACRALLKSYLSEKDSIEKTEKLCWAGKTKKESLYSDKGKPKSRQTTLKTHIKKNVVIKID